MLTVRGVVDRVGPTLLRAVFTVDEPGPVSDVVIAEPGRHTHLAAGDLVLGVAVGTGKDAVELVRHAGERGAAAVLLKPPVAAQSTVLGAGKAAGTSVVEVRSGTGWAQLVWLLRTVLDAEASETDGEDQDPGGLGDLFRLADAVASVIDAPVTIEDASSRVLAYSARQDRTDPARVSTIMGRRVPDDVLARFRSRGVFRELSRGGNPIYVAAQRDGTLPRLIVPIRMGGELLGSMWAVVPGRVPDARAAAFADAGSVVALHLLRRRARVDVERRHSAERVRALLEGEGSVRVAVAELDLADVPHRVVAIDAAGRLAADDLRTEGLRLALWERITSGIGRRPAVADLNGLLYAVVPDGPGDGGWDALRAALTHPPGDRALAAAGAPAPLTELRRSRAQAQETLGLLRAGLVPGPVADYVRTWAVLALHRLATAAASAGVTDVGPVPRLREHDEANGTEYVRTLYEWLRHPGDPRAAGQALRIHPNTLRYRMRKITELAGVDLGDPDVRLALLTQLVTVHWS
ncbi:MAG TPA: helix-turn-helix domain-containing protein [Pseudonocardiaceae bacterium]|nr:helix-turn-helix domain-containing protein [Pseudonocardiaceae bacterium]